MTHHLRSLTPQEKRVALDPDAWQVVDDHNEEGGCCNPHYCKSRTDMSREDS